MKTLLTVYGSPTPPGKLARALAAAEDHAAGLAGWRASRLSPLTPTAWPEDAAEQVAAASGVVVASPVFRASFPATLKLLFDALGVEAFGTRPVAILTVAAAPEHALGAERHLRDVLAWFGALTAPSPLFLPDRLLAGPDLDAEVRADLAALVDQVVALAGLPRGDRLGPAPLAARRAPRADLSPQSHTEPRKDPTT
ncbi:NAD(P)H-dependent oxidoreductase [Nocardioides carbamazepini]|uniref:NADPH-dependent FMN reductase n=1 Tax=Nocardioides carbamazepini TaxID=2854259 RepID=UPI002149AFA5|nr:NAD(P)H-dependent oxidoreductase [Nocardioides carbamazepini]MCR1782423.1 NAD(P)H-dependent oxidoreductase [Nocardioides carbamazepini]